MTQIFSYLSLFVYICIIINHNTMKSLKTYILDSLEQVCQPIVEHAFSKAAVIEKASNFDKQILLHLAKLHTDPNGLNVNKHIADICNWIYDIYELRSKSTKPSLDNLVMIAYTRKDNTFDDNVLNVIRRNLSKRYTEEQTNALDSRLIAKLNAFMHILKTIDLSAYDDTLSKIVRSIFTA